MRKPRSTNRVRGTHRAVQEAARGIRREATLAEETLWRELRDRGLAGVKFRWQHAVGPFVLDFYCPAAGLVVEVDGPIHDSRSAEDAARSAQLEATGLRVLRFTNDAVLRDLPNVLRAVRESIGAAQSHVPPLPILGEGVRG